MFRYLITDGIRCDGTRVDIEIENESITAVRPAGTADETEYDPERRYAANGRLITPSLTDPHSHLDATLTAGDPSWNESETLSEGISIWTSREDVLTVRTCKQEPSARSNGLPVTASRGFELMPRTLVLNRGREIARTEPATATVVRKNSERTVDYTHPRYHDIGGQVAYSKPLYPHSEYG